MRSTALLVVVCVAGLAGSGCASILRGSRSELVLNGARGEVRAFALGEEIALKRVSTNSDGTAKYTGEVPFKAQELRLHTEGLQVPVPLERSVGVGWVVTDLLLAGLLGIIIDAATGKWSNLEDVEVARAVARARASGQASMLATSSPAPPSQQAPPAQTARSEPPPPIQERDAAPAVDRQAESRARPASGRRPLVEKGRLAVLDFKSYTTDFKPEDVRYFNDVVRGATLRVSPNLEVMTRENLIVMLKSTGKSLEQCEGECEVETGRRIGADAIVTGEVLKVGSRFKMSLRLHDTNVGRLLSTAIASGKTIDELDESVQKAADELFHGR